MAATIAGKSIRERLQATGNAVLNRCPANSPVAPLQRVATCKPLPAFRPLHAATPVQQASRTPPVVFLPYRAWKNNIDSGASEASTDVPTPTAAMTPKSALATTPVSPCSFAGRGRPHGGFCMSLWHEDLLASEAPQIWPVPAVPVCYPEEFLASILLLGQGTVIENNLRLATWLQEAANAVEIYED